MLFKHVIAKKSKRQVPFLRVPAIKPGPEPTYSRGKGENMN
jgi:hypothetical protein